MIETIPKPELVAPSQAVEHRRSMVSMALESTSAPLVGIIGPCAPDTPDIETLNSEGKALAMLSDLVPKLLILHGLPVRKPRTPRPDQEEVWKGMETTDPEGALRLLEQSSRDYAHTSLEFVEDENIDSYAHLPAFVWTGARNEENVDLKIHLVTAAPTLPIGIKNGLSGEVDLALAQIEYLRQRRGPNGAPIVLLYRGGENARTPDAWEKHYLDALARTKGKLIVDVAHGGEMAHDPTGMFTKSAAGQIACLEHVIMLAEAGYVPAGIKMEASDTPRRIDPPITFQIAINGLLRLRLAVPNYEV